MDGVDIAVIRTDGQEEVEAMEDGFLSVPYSNETRRLLRDVLLCEDIETPAMRAASDAVTAEYIAALDQFFAQGKLTKNDIDLIGAHGQTVTHRPDKGLTIQLGNPQAIANHCGIPVVFDLRQNDVAHGGQGAPLLPVYHRALIHKAGVGLPAAVLNMGGVGNMTFIGTRDDAFLAFDTGPANAYVDDWMMQKTAKRMDEGGKMAETGRVDSAVVDGFLNNPYFDRPAPKSLDREDFAAVMDAVAHLSVADGAATLVECSVMAVAAALRHVPHMPNALFVCGGGSRNPYLMARLAAIMPCRVHTLDDLGTNPESVEAEGFAYMAARCLTGAPISFSGTTGAPYPLGGGVVYEPRAAGGGVNAPLLQAQMPMRD